MAVVSFPITGRADSQHLPVSNALRIRDRGGRANCVPLDSQTSPAKITPVVKPEPTVEVVRSRLDYDPDTGIFIWRRHPGTGNGAKILNATYPGKVAGTIGRDGYAKITLNQRICRAHRLAWMHFHGETPPSEIDHRDRNRANNAIANLRAADDYENMWNRSLNKTNTSGFKGVTWHKKNKIWVASIFVAHRRIYLGSFTEIHAAAAAYVEAAKFHFGDFATDGVSL